MTSEFLTRDQLAERYGKTPDQVSALVSRERRKGRTIRTEESEGVRLVSLDDFRRYCVSQSSAARRHSESMSNTMSRKARR